MRLLKLLRGVPWWIYVVLAASASTYLYIGHLKGEIIDQEEIILDLSAQKDSLEAVNDTTRDITNLLRDKIGSLEEDQRFLQRRIVQVELERDSIDEALNQESKARYSLQVQVSNLHTFITTTEYMDSLGYRTARFSEYQKPYTTTAIVNMPPFGEGRANMDLTISLDPATLNIRATCGDRDPNTGLRPASILLNTPAWLQTSVGNVYQDKELCNYELVNPPERKDKGILKSILTAGAFIAIWEFFLEDQISGNK